MEKKRINKSELGTPIHGIVSFEWEKCRKDDRHTIQIIQMNFIQKQFTIQSESKANLLHISNFNNKINK